MESAVKMVLAGLKGYGSVDDLVRRYGVSRATYYALRKKFLKGGIEGLKSYGEAGKPEYVKVLERRIRELERELSKKSLEAERLKQQIHR